MTRRRVADLASQQTPQVTEKLMPRWLPESMDLLADVVQALSKAEGGDYRSRFERVVTERTGLPYVRLADEGSADARGAGGLPLSFRVPWAARAVVVRADAHVRQDLADPKRRRLLRAAAQVAVVILKLEEQAAAADAAAKATNESEVRESQPMPNRPNEQPTERLLLGSSGVMDEVRERIARVARTDYRVLIEGETGAGKEIVARQIHRLSQRSAGPFVAINCAALVDSLMDAQLFGIEDRTATGVRGQRGLFEKAQHGVLFLDEVGELPLQAQAKLLRVLQEECSERVGGAPRQIDVRVIAATNRRLKELVTARLFREDLYYRLNAVEVRVPPLREHPEDILELATAHLKRGHPRTVTIAKDAVEALMLYEWPGNVRQLERVIERAVTEGDGDEIALTHLPESIRDPYGFVMSPEDRRDDSMRSWRKRYARIVLHRCGDNKREACRVLDISYHTLRSYLWDDPRPVREVKRRRRAKRRSGS